MASRSTRQLLSGLCLALGLALPSAYAHHLDLNTFAGQAEAWRLEPIVATQGRSEVLGSLRARDDELPDYSCTATKGCKLGCCGPL